MKKQNNQLILLIGSLILCTAIFLLTTAGAAAAAQQSQHANVDIVDLNGSGTQTDPYVITNISELQSIENNLQAHYILRNDINASETARWNGRKGFEPIGGTRSYTGSTPPSFTGSLDGNGHAIIDITINRSNSKNVALFSWIGGSGRVSNIVIKNTSVTGSIRAAGLSGVNDGKVTNATVTGQITGSDDVGGIIASNNGELQASAARITVSAMGSQLGGLVGSNLGKIISSSADSQINGSVSLSNGASYVGGVTGLNQGYIRDVSVKTAVNGTSSVGGIAGWNVRGDVINSSVTGSVNGSTKVGGLVGRNQNATIAYSSAKTTITGNTDAGGLVGLSRQTAVIKSSTAGGSVKGNPSVGYVIGGLVGANKNSRILNASTSSSVLGTSRVGGLVGYNTGEIKDTYAVGSVTGTNSVGGVIGVDSGSVSDSYWDTNTTGLSRSAGGVGLSTNQMTGQAAQTNMSGLPFGTAWHTRTSDYPELIQKVNRSNRSKNIGNSTSNYASINLSKLSGNGTSDAPFVITNISELQAIENNLSAHYELGNKIDASQTSGWNNGSGFSPIGDSKSPFTGSLNGTNYTISKLYMNRSKERFVGLIGHTGKSASVSNIRVEHANITGSEYVGGIIGEHNHSRVKSSHVSGNISGNYAIGGIIGNNGPNSTVNRSHATVNISEYRDSIFASTAGGVAGKNEGIVIHSSSGGSVYANTAGGLIGRNNGSVQASHATGIVSGHQFIGGLVGVNNQTGVVTASHATGTVTNSSQPSLRGGVELGGLVGSNLGYVNSSYATTNVSRGRFNDDLVGGLIGVNNGFINNSNASGSVSGVSSVGGLVGLNSRDPSQKMFDEVNATVKNSYATGNVNGTDSVGGLVGHNNATISKSHAENNVSGSSFDTGGFVGTNDRKIINSYANSTVSGDENVGGLVGSNVPNSTITYSYASGSISGLTKVGGLIGDNRNNATVRNSYAGTTVSGNSTVGGLIGRSGYVASTADYHGNATVNETYATGTVSGSNQTGGLIGYQFGNTTIKSSYWSYTSTGQTNSAGGVSLKSYKMRGLIARDNMEGLSFGTYWQPQRGDYPVLVWQTNSNGGGAAKNSPPTAQIEYTPSSVTAGATVRFSANSSTDPDGNIEVYEWDLDGDGMIEATGENITYNYSRLGRSDISLTTIDNNTAINTTSQKITVKPTLKMLSGNGSATDPYVITDVLDLQAIKNDVNANYTIGNSINASTASNWYNGDGFEPIGNSQSPFSGTLQGGNSVISNLTINRTRMDNVGLFGQLDSGASVTNVRLEYTNITGKDNVGGVVGHNDGTVSRSYVTGSITGSNHVGGLVGVNNNTIKKSYSNGNTNGKIDVGGVVGLNSNSANITNSYANSTVSGTDSVGGVIGRNRGVLSNSFAASNISSSDSAGGVVGENYGIATNSYYDSKIFTQTSLSVGNGRTTSEMTGIDAVTNMSKLPFGTVWKTQANSYPLLTWESKNRSNRTSPGDLTGNGQVAQDIDNDGIYEDINGDGSADLKDLQPFFNLVRPSASKPNNPSLFDINGDGSADLKDLQPFFDDVRPLK